MDEIKKVMNIIDLYDIYKPLLTEKQQQYFEDYYFDDLSLSEVALKYNVSRNAIYSRLQDTICELEEYEKKLHLLKKQKKRSELISSLKDKNVKDFETIISKLEEII